MPKKPNLGFETWMHSKWRPMMGWMYMAVCVCDFIIFPVGYTFAQIYGKVGVGQQLQQWVPLTLNGAGLFHMAMGAVLGIYVWSRGQEKMQGVSGGSMTQYSDMPYSRGQQMGYRNYSEESTVDRISTVGTGQKGRVDPKSDSLNKE